MSASTPRKARKHPSDTNENELGQKKQVRHSASVSSLRSFVKMKRFSVAEPLPAISQPVLNDSSREKVRNKIRQSPSMLSVGLACNAELCSEIESRLTDELVQLSVAGTIEPGFFPDLTDSLKMYKFIDLSKSTLEETLKLVRIHRIMRTLDGICPILDVHVVPGNGSSTSSSMSGGQLSCVLEMPHVGTRLDRFHFESSLEAYKVLIRVAEILAEAERSFQFEHRNLCPKNVCVERSCTNGDICRVTIVDCKLARISAPKTVLSTSLDHPGFYEARLPVLAKMRRLVARADDFEPGTNVLWLTFLARYLYNRAPGIQLKRASETLSAKWTLRNAPRSAREALVRLRKTQL